MMKTKTVPRPVQKIVLPVDFTDCSDQAAQTAVGIAKLLRATIVLVYVIEGKAPGSEFLSSSRAEFDVDARKLATKELLRFRRARIPKSCKCECVVRSGQADTEILALADEVKPAMIVMAVHGKASERGQLGRTMERVAAIAACPVLLVPVTERCVPFFI